MKTFIKITSMLLVMSTSGFAQTIITTENPQIGFFYKASDAGVTPPEKGQAAVGAINPETQAILWAKSMGMSSTIKIAASPDGRVLALLSGDQRKNLAYPATEGSQNTLYLIEGTTGRTLARINPLQEANAPKWAEDAWQDLNLTFTPEGLNIQGKIFSYPNHPTPKGFRYLIPQSVLP